MQCISENWGPWVPLPFEYYNGYYIEDVKGHKTVYVILMLHSISQVRYLSYAHDMLCLTQCAGSCSCYDGECELASNSNPSNEYYDDVLIYDSCG